MGVQGRIAALFGGIPQHGPVLGQATAPVTLQVFIDLEDQLDSGYWFKALLPPILEQFVRTNVVRLEFHSLMTDTLNARPFIMQQTAALAAGEQNLLWNYAATFLNTPGREFTNYVNERFLTGIAKQISGLNITRWDRFRTAALARVVALDNNAARRFGLRVTPAFRVGLTKGKFRNFSGRTVLRYYKDVLGTTSTGEHYLAGGSSELQRPISLITADELKKIVEELI
jgi:hypothetical protein